MYDHTFQPGKSPDQRSCQTWSELSAWWLHMVTLIFLRGDEQLWKEVMKVQDKVLVMLVWYDSQQKLFYRIFKNPKYYYNSHYRVIPSPFKLYTGIGTYSWKRSTF